MIYFIQQGSLFDKKIKIGCSNNPQKRLRELQISTPNKLKLLLVLFGDSSVEVYYHDLFAKYHIQGEWFQYGMKLRLFIWLHSNGLDLTNKKSVTIQKESSLIKITAQRKLSKAKRLSQLETLIEQDPKMTNTALGKTLGVSRQTIISDKKELSPPHTNGVA